MSDKVGHAWNCGFEMLSGVTGEPDRFRKTANGCTCGLEDLRLRAKALYASENEVRELKKKLSQSIPRPADECEKFHTHDGLKCPGTCVVQAGELEEERERAEKSEARAVAAEEKLAVIASVVGSFWRDVNDFDSMAVLNKISTLLNFADHPERPERVEMEPRRDYVHLVRADCVLSGVSHVALDRETAEWLKGSDERVEQWPIERRDSPEQPELVAVGAKGARCSAVTAPDHRPDAPSGESACDSCGDSPPHCPESNSKLPPGMGCSEWTEPAVDDKPAANETEGGLFDLLEDAFSEINGGRTKISSEHNLWVFLQALDERVERHKRAIKHDEEWAMRKFSELGRDVDDLLHWRDNAWLAMDNEKDRLIQRLTSRVSDLEAPEGEPCEDYSIETECSRSDMHHWDDQCLAFTPKTNSPAPDDDKPETPHLCETCRVLGCRDFRDHVPACPSYKSCKPEPDNPSPEPCGYEDCDECEALHGECSLPVTRHPAPDRTQQSPKRTHTAPTMPDTSLKTKENR